MADSRRASDAGGPTPGAAQPDPLDRQTGWRGPIREVVLVALVIVGAVLGLAVLTGFLPVGLQRIVFHTPLTIGVLVVGTIWVLWRIGSRRPPAG